jgi:hypothetical protein
MKGFLNGAPYLASALTGCWTNVPLKKMFGRRGTHLHLLFHLVCDWTLDDRS